MMRRFVVNSKFVPALFLVLIAVVTGQGTESLAPITTTPEAPILLPPYDVYTEVRTVTPTCIQLWWNISPPLNHSAYADNIFRIASVKTWVIELNILTHSNELTEGNNELFINGSVSDITLGPLPLGATVRATVNVHKYIKPDGRTKEGEHITAGTDTALLPRSDKNCPWPYGRRENPCSGCVCTTTAFTGPRCQEPTFHPGNVSAWVLSNSTLHIQWTFNRTKYRSALSEVNFKLLNFSLSITEASEGSLVVRDTIPINLQSDIYNYNVYENLTSGVEYDVTVGTAASCRSEVVVANASSLRTLIPGNLGAPDTQDGDTSLRLTGAALPGVVVGVAVFSCLLATIVSVVITLACARRRSSEHATGEQEPVRAQNPSSNTAPRPPLTRVLPTMAPNPAYGASNFSSSSFGSPSFGSSTFGFPSSGSTTRNFFVQNGQLVTLPEQYENDDITEDKTGTGTYDYVAPQIR